MGTTALITGILGFAAPAVGGVLQGKAKTAETEAAERAARIAAADTFGAADALAVIRKREQTTYIILGVSALLAVALILLYR